MYINIMINICTWVIIIKQCTNGSTFIIICVQCWWKSESNVIFENDTVVDVAGKDDGSLQRASIVQRIQQ